MSRYDGLIIPRSYSEYINKTDAATLSQALQLNNVLAQVVAAGDNRAVTSGAVKIESERSESIPITTSSHISGLANYGFYKKNNLVIIYATLITADTINANTTEILVEGLPKPLAYDDAITLDLVEAQGGKHIQCQINSAGNLAVTYAKSPIFANEYYRLQAVYICK